MTGGRVMTCSKSPWVGLKPWASAGYLYVGDTLRVRETHFNQNTKIFIV